MRKMVRYPNAQHPSYSGVCYVDEDSDPDVSYYHYQDFWKPGWPKPRTFMVEVEKATGRAREVKTPPMIFH